MNVRKDELAQVYFKKVIQEGTVDRNYRHYIYSKVQYANGGLYVNARGLTNEEKVKGGLAYNTNVVQFTFNRNNEITQSCKIVYKNEIYDIDTIDPLDFRAKEMKVRAKKSADKTKYKGDEFNE